MTIEAYTNPDFGWKEKLIFFLLAFAGVAICAVLIIAFTRISLSGKSKYKRDRLTFKRSQDRVQRLYEMIMAGTSVMSFSCAYVIINHVYGLLQGGAGSPGPVLKVLMDAWTNGRDFVLLLLICLSCVLNSILDKVFIRIKAVPKSEKATIRMLGMFYVIIILVILNHVGDESEYNPVMMYYLGLMVGRFVYFDASFGDFVDAVKAMLKDVHLLIMGLLLTGLLCWFGLDAGYLLERNYYIVGVFYTNLFMLAASFVLHHSHLLYLFVHRPRGDAGTDDADGDDDEAEGDADGYEDRYSDETDYYEDEEDDEYDEDVYDENDPDADSELSSDYED